MTTTIRQSARGASYYVAQEDFLPTRFVDTTLTPPSEGMHEHWKPVIDELLAARNLMDDWDGQGAKAPTNDVVDTALKLAVTLQKQGQQVPDDYGPGVNGTITLGWRTEELSVELEVLSPLRIEGYRWKRGAERAEQFVLASDR